MIDFILMRKEQRKLCCDLRVCRSICSWSDHHLVRGKLQIQLPKRSKATNYAPLAVHRLSKGMQRAIPGEVESTTQCMYVCMYVCMCVYVCVCMYVCMYVCMHVCMHVCMYVLW